MEYAPLEKRPDQPETNERTDAGRFVGSTFIPAAEPEYRSVWPYMPGMHVGSGTGRSELEAMFWQAHFGISSGNPLLDSLNPFMRPQGKTESGGASGQVEPRTSSTISRAPAVQPSTAEDGFPLNEAQAEKVDTALAETGQPLPEEQKAVYEAHTGHDFSRVRVHTGAAAEEAADSIGAKAFAKGSDIVFAKDQYNPSTAEGRGLIGHELAHVAQSATGVHRAPKEGEKQEDSWLQSLRKKGEESYSKIVDVNQRLGYIDRARDLSNKYERQSLFKRLERDAIDLLIGLLAVMLIAGLTIVFSVLLGALVGSLAGPSGAALGAFIGLKISVALVEFFGLVAIMTFVYATLKEAGLHYWNFLTLAWNSQGNEQQIDKAAQECAEGNVTIAAALLEGIVLYGIGRGLTATMAKFKNSRFVQWVGVDRFEAWLKGKFKQKEPIPETETAVPEKRPTEKGVDGTKKTIEKGNKGEGEYTDTSAPKNFDFNAYLRRKIGPPPDGMLDPHAHHILFKEGLGDGQKALVRKGQALLRRYDIHPIFGIENLVWAPNRIKGQHDIHALRYVVEQLEAVEGAGGSRQQIIKMLNRLGQIAAQRR